jgi:hypothetical protein
LSRWRAGPPLLLLLLLPASQLSAAPPFAIFEGWALQTMVSGGLRLPETRLSRGILGVRRGERILGRGLRCQRFQCRKGGPARRMSNKKMVKRDDDAFWRLPSQLKPPFPFAEGKVPTSREGGEKWDTPNPRVAGLFGFRNTNQCGNREKFKCLTDFSSGGTYRKVPDT